VSVEAKRCRSGHVSGLGTPPLQDILAPCQLREIDAELGIVWQPLHPNLQTKYKVSLYPVPLHVASTVSRFHFPEVFP